MDVPGIWDNPTRSVPMKMFRSSSRFLIVALAGLSAFLTSCASLESAGGSRLDLVKARGELLCGVSGKIPGFSFLSPDGRYTGMDVDVCRAMAAAFVGDADKVQYRPLTAPERFTALRSGEIDLLSRNTTHTLSRDAVGGNGLRFAPVVFHDGQGLMVRAASGVRSLADLSGKSICVDQAPRQNRTSTTPSLPKDCLTHRSNTRISIRWLVATSRGVVKP